MMNSGSGDASVASTGEETNSDISLNDLSVNHNNDLFAGAVQGACQDSLAQMGDHLQELETEQTDNRQTRKAASKKKILVTVPVVVKEEEQYLLAHTNSTSNDEYAQVARESANLWDKAITTMTKSKCRKSTSEPELIDDLEDEYDNTSMALSPERKGELSTSHEMDRKPAFDMTKIVADDIEMDVDDYKKVGEAVAVGGAALVQSADAGDVRASENARDVRASGYTGSAKASENVVGVIASSGNSGSLRASGNPGTLRASGKAGGFAAPGTAAGVTASGNAKGVRASGNAGSLRASGTEGMRASGLEGGTRAFGSAGGFSPQKIVADLSAIGNGELEMSISNENNKEEDVAPSNQSNSMSPEKAEKVKKHSTQNLTSSDYSIDGDSAILWGDDPEKAYFGYMMQQEDEKRALEGKDQDDSLMDSYRKDILHNHGETSTLEDDTTTLGHGSRALGWEPSTVVGASHVGGSQMGTSNQGGVSTLTPSFVLGSGERDKHGNLIIPNVIYVQDESDPRIETEARAPSKRQIKSKNSGDLGQSRRSSSRRSNGGKSAAAVKQLDNAGNDGEESRPLPKSGWYTNRILIGFALFFLVLTTGLVAALVVYRNHYADNGDDAIDINSIPLDENGNPIILVTSGPQQPTNPPSFPPTLAPSVFMDKKDTVDDDDFEDEEEVDIDTDPILEPSSSPTTEPTATPTSASPTSKPTAPPTSAPSLDPTITASIVPTWTPTGAPTFQPSQVASVSQTEILTSEPTDVLDTLLTSSGTEDPTMDVTSTEEPTLVVSLQPTESLTLAPSEIPRDDPAISLNETQDISLNETQTSLNETQDISLNETQNVSLNETQNVTFSEAPTPASSQTSTGSWVTVSVGLNSTFEATSTPSNGTESYNFSAPEKEVDSDLFNEDEENSTNFTDYINGTSQALDTTISSSPTETPTADSTQSAAPSGPPSMVDSVVPTYAPSPPPSMLLSALANVSATDIPSSEPTWQPTKAPSFMPFALPSGIPSTSPTFEPSKMPSFEPSERPTSTPSERPTSKPSESPTSKPSERPTRRPTTAPSVSPSSNMPSIAPSLSPTTFSPTEPLPAYVAIDTVRNFVLDYSPMSSDELFDQRSVQFLALQWLAQWMASIPPRELGRTTKKRLIQRWALTVVYLSLGGPNWLTGSDDWNSGNDHCDWLTLNDQGTCNEEKLVTSLDLGDNNLKGTLPKEIALLSDSLARLEMDRNEIAGQIPVQFGDMYELVTMDFTRCDLTGPLPTQLGWLTNLAILGLGRNDFVGTLPTQLGNLDNLVYLGLERNDLTGTIPEELTTLTNLEYLALDWNALVGAVPPSISNLSNLNTLILARNGLVGEIPDAFCQRSMDFMAADCEEVTCDCCDLCCVNGEGCGST